MRNSFVSLFVLFIFFCFFLFNSVKASATEVAVVLPSVKVQASTTADASLLGFEGFQLQEIPASVNSYDDETVQQNRILRLADLTVLDASLTDSYNATGYWDMVSIRGYTLDNRSNYRREGLPINAETAIPLENKASVQVLKGLAGIQSGVSTPGGVVNYQVKRPPSKLFFDMQMDVTDAGNFLVAVDSGGPHPQVENLDFRINMGMEYLSPHLKDARGRRSLVAIAGSYRLPHQALLEAEFEISNRSQPSQPGMSLLGAALPSLTDPNINLNNQSWSQPVEFFATTGTVKYSQNLQEDLNWSATLGLQSLINDDHLAYPFGCTKEGNFDRYCSDGTFDFYDFRSENEHRDTYAARLALSGSAPGEVSHSWSVGTMAWRAQERYQRQAYNYVGEGRVDGTAVVPEDPSLTDESTDRSADNLQVYASEAIKWKSWTGWIGGSWNGIQRSSVRTDGSRATDYYQSFLLPWLALSYQHSKTMMYVSYAQGMESFVTPNRNTYSHPGEFLPDVRSHQYEIGVRRDGDLNMGLAVFQIFKPVVTDQAPVYQVDGEDVHQGLEADVRGDVERWQWSAAAMLLKAKRQNSDFNPTENGQRPVNVPDTTLRLGARYQAPWVSGLSLKGRMVYEGERAVLADNSMAIPGWVRWDAGIGYFVKSSTGAVRFEFLAENLLNNKYWRESPTQYGHVYLYPGTERLFSLNIAMNY